MLSVCPYILKIYKAPGGVLGVKTGMLVFGIRRISLYIARTIEFWKQGYFSMI